MTTSTNGSGRARVTVEYEDPRLLPLHSRNECGPGEYEHLRRRARRDPSTIRASEPLLVYVWGSCYAYNAATRTLEVRLTGSLDGDSAPVTVVVDDFLPHFYVRLPRGWGDAEVDALMTQLEDALHWHIGDASQGRWWQLRELMRRPAAEPPRRPAAAPLTEAEGLARRGRRTALVLGYKVTRGDELMGYDGAGERDVIDVRVAHPALVRVCRTLLENVAGRRNHSYKRDGVDVAEPDVHAWCHATLAAAAPFRLYEADVDFMMRFFSDRHQVPARWYTVAAGRYRVMRADRPSRSKADVELTCSADALSELPDETDADAALVPPVPDFTMLAFDIECETNGKRFPMVSHGDPILQVCATISTMRGGLASHKHVAFVLDRTFRDDAIETWCCRDQATLLDEFASMFETVDPDVVTHYNGNGFDFPYMLDMAERLKLRDYAHRFSRMRGDKLRLKKRFDTIRGQDKHDATLPGRLNMDMLRVMQVAFDKPEELTLNAVAAKFLNGEVKDEMDVALISRYQTTADGRARMRKYCSRDAHLVLRIVARRNEVLNTLAMARIACIPPQMVLDRAEGVKIEGRLRWRCFDPARGAPLLKVTGGRKRVHDAQSVSATGKGYQGASVLTPRRDFYDHERVVDRHRAALFAAEMEALARNRAAGVPDDAPPDAPGRTAPRYAEYVEMLARFEAAAAAAADATADAAAGPPPIKRPRRPPGAGPTAAAAAAAAAASDDGDGSARERRARAEFEERLSVAEMLMSVLRVYDPSFVATLDFAAMYPSIMRAHNLCFSTLVSDEFLRAENERRVARGEAPWVQGVDYWRLCKNVVEPSPDGVGYVMREVCDDTKPAFLAPHVRVGVLPSMQTECGQARSKIKKRGAALKARWTAMVEVDGVSFDDPRVIALQYEEALCDALQNAYKRWMNSMYGLTGFVDSSYYQPEIAETVTGRGRTMIERIRFEAHQRFCRARGWPFDARVVYGDTDSIMVWFQGLMNGDEALACAIGHLAATVITTASFPKEIELAFEKVLMRFALLAKKMYLSLKVELAKRDAAPDVKGLDSLRRGPPPYHKRSLAQLVALVTRDGVSLDEAARYCWQQLQRLRDHRVNPLLLVKRTQIKRALDDYGKTVTYVHKKTGETREKKNSESAAIVLAKRMRAENAESAPKPGDIITYVMVDVPGAYGSDAKKRKVTHGARDAMTALDQGTPLDWAYYHDKLESGFMKLVRPVLLRHAGGAMAARVGQMQHDASEASDDVDVPMWRKPYDDGVSEPQAASGAARHALDKAGARLKSDAKSKRKIAELTCFRDVMRRASGERARKRRAPVQRTAAMAAFVRVADAPCAACGERVAKRPRAEHDEVVCDACAVHARAHLEHAAWAADEAGRREGDAWDACSRCMGVELRIGAAWLALSERLRAARVTSAPLQTARADVVYNCADAHCSRGTGDASAGMLCARCTVVERACTHDDCVNNASLYADGRAPSSWPLAWRRCATCEATERAETRSCVNAGCDVRGERTMLADEKRAALARRDVLETLREGW